MRFGNNLLIITAGRGGRGQGRGGWCSNRLASLFHWLCSKKPPHGHAETSSLEDGPKFQASIGVKERGLDGQNVR